MAEYSVVSIGYRLAPEYPFPTGLKDCYNALQWIEENHDVVDGSPAHIAVGGKSAGGNLAIALAHLSLACNGPSIAHQLATVPPLDQPRSTFSYRENATGFGLTRADMEWYWNHYIRDGNDEKNTYASPLQARDLSELPPTTVATAGFDPLRDDGFEYVECLAEHDVPVTHYHYPDMPHSLTSTTYYYRDIGRAREAIKDIANSLKEEAT